jgi:hypothetical protein
MAVNQGQKSFFERLSLLQKIIIFLLILGLVFVIYTYAIGGVQTLFDWIIILVFSVGLIFFIYLIAFYFENKFARVQYFEAYEDYKTKVVNLAIQLKPKNVFNLVYEGSENKQRVVAGKIIGVLGIPAIYGKPKFDADGNILYKKSPVLKGALIPDFEKIWLGNTGDYVFVVTKGWFLFKQTFLHRADPEFIRGELHGDVVINDINPDYVGVWAYPFKQKQRDITRIMCQHQMEAIISTYTHQLDYISYSFESGLSSNPYYRAWIENVKGGNLGGVANESAIK